MGWEDSSNQQCAPTCTNNRLGLVISQAFLKNFSRRFFFVTSSTFKDHTSPRKRRTSYILPQIKHLCCFAGFAAIGESRRSRCLDFDYRPARKVTRVSTKSSLLCFWTYRVALSFRMDRYIEGNRYDPTPCDILQTTAKFTRLLEHIQRWEDISITADWGLTTLFLKNIKPGVAPQLMSLQLDVDRPSESHGLASKLCMLPSLRRLQISVSHWYGWVPDPNAPTLLLNLPW
jgi:hypothetical protein